MQGSQVFGRQAYFFTPETAYICAQADLAVVGVDERLKYSSRLYEALAAMAKRFESIFAVANSGGPRTSVESLLWHDIISRSAPSAQEELAMMAPASYREEAKSGAVREAVNYTHGLDWVTRTVSPGVPLQPTLLYNLHRLCLQGSLEGDGPRLRKQPLGENDIGIILPTPAEIPLLIEKLCDFLNAKRYAPAQKASIAHFQLECLTPFESLNNRVGLLLAQALFRQLSLTTGAVPIPISWAGWVDMQSKNELHHPYRSISFDEYQDLDKAMNDWVRFTARCTKAGVHFLDVLDNLIESQYAAWIERMGRVSRNSAEEKLLAFLFEYPLFTAKQAAGVMGKSFSATNAALAKIEDKGIVSYDRMNNKERMFIAHDVVALLKSLEKKLLPKDEKESGR